MSKRLGEKLAPLKVRAREKENLQPTTAQLEALRVFQELAERHGKPPTKRELSAAMGLSESGAQTHLVQLTVKGLLVEKKELVVVGRAVTPLGEKWLQSKITKI